MRKTAYKMQHSSAYYPKGEGTKKRDMYTQYTTNSKKKSCKNDVKCLRKNVDEFFSSNFVAKFRPFELHDERMHHVRWIVSKQKYHVGLRLDEK